jgi:anti-sigma B factor antagonist
MRQADGVVILDLAGSIDVGESSSELHLNLRSLAAEGKRSVILNFERIKSIDSCGLGTLVAGYTTLERVGGRLKLLNLSPKIAELMTVTRLYALLEIFDNEALAIASFKNLGRHFRRPPQDQLEKIGVEGSSIL